MLGGWILDFQLLYYLLNCITLSCINYLNGSRKFCSESVSIRGFMCNNATTSLFNRIENCFSIPRENGNQIYHLTWDTKSLLSNLRNLLYKMNCCFKFSVSGIHLYIQINVMWIQKILHLLMTCTCVPQAIKVTSSPKIKGYY